MSVGKRVQVPNGSASAGMQLHKLDCWVHGYKAQHGLSRTCQRHRQIRETIAYQTAVKGCIRQKPLTCGGSPAETPPGYSAYLQGQLPSGQHMEKSSGRLDERGSFGAEETFVQASWTMRSRACRERQQDRKAILPDRPASFFAVKQAVLALRPVLSGYGAIPFWEGLSLLHGDICRYLTDAIAAC